MAVKVKDLAAWLAKLPQDAPVVLEAPDVVEISDVYLTDLGVAVIRGLEPE